MASLPSFICTQTTEQFQSDKKARHWRKGDTLTSQLVFDLGQEQRTLELVNNRPVSRAAAWRSPLVSEGEFGKLLDSILGDSSQASFAWHGWDTLGDKRVAVFEYQVDKRHSPWQLALGPAQARVAFHGLVYADTATGTVWRVTNDAADFPAELRTKSISRWVDFGEVTIGTTRHVLPVHAIVLLDTGTGHIKNDLHFDGYRKFGVDSRISFPPADVSKSANPDVINH